MKRIRVTTYFLEMVSPPSGRPLHPPKGAAIEPAPDVSVAAYRKLYDLATQGAGYV